MATNDVFVDTETAGSLTTPFVYDFGLKSYDGTIQINYAIDEIFFDKTLMDTAYYREKIPKYYDEIWDSERIIENFFRTRAEIHRLFKENKIKRVFAHNARFDVNALNNTCRALSNGKIKFFFPYGTEICDTLKMARQVVGKMPTYKKYCLEHGYMTKHKVPRPRLTAEILYRFISKDESFQEAHTGLKDVEIEQIIYQYIMRQHKKCNCVLYPAKG